MLLTASIAVDTPCPCVTHRPCSPRSRFQPVVVPEPTIEETFEILQGKRWWLGGYRWLGGYNLQGFTRAGMQTEGRVQVEVWWLG